MTASNTLIGVLNILLLLKSVLENQPSFNKLLFFSLFWKQQISTASQEICEKKKTPQGLKQASNQFNQPAIFNRNFLFSQV